MLALLLMGISLGLAAGISPGPLLTLVISTSLERGFAAGMRVALAPLISDLPIVSLTVLILPALSVRFLTVITVIGSAFVIFLGIETLVRCRRAVPMVHAGTGATKDVWRASLVNLLNPNPWIFWFSVGGPLLVGAWRSSPLHATLFVGGFYGLLVGSKVVVAGAVAGGRGRLNLAWYRVALAACGIMLIALGILLLRRI